MCAGQVRSAKLADVPCSCLALLDAHGDTLSSHPIALAGCYNNQVPASLFKWPDASVTGLLRHISFLFHSFIMNIVIGCCSCRKRQGASADKAAGKGCQTLPLCELDDDGGHGAQYLYRPTLRQPAQFHTIVMLYCQGFPARNDTLRHIVDCAAGVRHTTWEAAG
jgi:hypothetical protein